MGKKVGLKKIIKKVVNWAKKSGVKKSGKENKSSWKKSAVEKKGGGKKKSHQKVEKKNIIIIIIVSVTLKSNCLKTKYLELFKGKKTLKKCRKKSS